MNLRGRVPNQGEDFDKAVDFVECYIDCRSDTAIDAYLTQQLAQLRCNGSRSIRLDTEGIHAAEQPALDFTTRLAFGHPPPITVTR